MGIIIAALIALGTATGILDDATTSDGTSTGIILQDEEVL
jgi:hypothetical protein